MTLPEWRRAPPPMANFGLILMVLVLNGIVVHRNTIALHQSHDRVAHTHDVLTQIEQMFARLVEAESGVRGYAITGDDSYLETYRQEMNSLPEQVRALQASVKDNPVQYQKSRQLEEYVKSRLDQLHRVTVARAEIGMEAAQEAVTANVDKQATVRAHDIVESLKFEERRLLDERTRVAERQLYTILIANVIAIGLALVVCGVAWRLIDAQMRRCSDAESKAAAERENLLVTLTSIGDAVIVTDAKGHVQLLNPVAQHLLGYPKDLIGKRLLDVFSIVSESTRQPVENPVSKSLEIGATVELANHMLLLRPDGREVPIEVTAAPIRAKSSQLTGVVLVFRDSSERWRFERKLRDRERRFRGLFETPLIGIAVGTSSGKHLLEANDAYLDLIGYDRGEMPEASLGWGGVESGQSPLDEAAQRELQTTGFCRPFEQICTRTDGTFVPVLISATKLYDEEDRIIVFVTDLTTIKQSEAALRDSQNRFRILSESMPQMVWTALASGQVDYVNRTLTEYSGKTTDELKGWGWIDLLHNDDRQSYIDAWRAALDTGQPLQVEHRLLKRDGEYRWHLTRALPMYDADGHIALWVGTNTDIHDQKRVEAELKDEHQRKDQFLALLAHELRNPLAPLGNAVQIFPAVQHDPVKAAELVAIMQRQVKQMSRLIDDLLDLARITQGRIVLRREKTLVSSITAAAVEAVQPWIKERQHQLTVTLPSEELWIDADAARLSQILTNLLQNAAKYTEPGGQITLTVERADQQIVFRIQDNGPGLSAAMLTRIFDLFMQVEQTLNRAHGGLGIGLTLVRTLVELHGGTITAHSDGLGHGSTFVVRLPLSEHPANDSANAKGVELAAEPLPAMHVLVVDDVQASAKTLAMMLTVLGQNVEIALDGPGAIAAASTGTFDLAFLDIAMPGMDGLEVATHLRSNPDLEKLVLVALTGFGQDDDRQRSFAAGFNEHLIKPTSIDLLRDVLRRTAQQKSLA